MARLTTDPALLDLEYYRRALARAREHVNKAQKLADQQRVLVSSIKDGSDLAGQAKTLLAHLEDSLEFLLRHRDSLAEFVREAEQNDQSPGSYTLEPKRQKGLQE